MTYLINRKRFILDNIEALLKAGLSPANIEASLSTQSFPELQLLLDDSCSSGIESLRAFRYQVPQVDFERLCQQNYSDLFRLQDHVAAWQQDAIWDALPLDAKAFYAALEKMLHAVQIFLESTGIRGMAAEELLPAHHLSLRLLEMGRNINLLRSRFLSAAADPVLQDLLVAHFQFFCTRQEVRQQELWYMEQLMEAMLAGLSTSKAEDNELFLMHELVKWNFNSPEGYGYCRDKLLAALGEKIGRKRRFLLLSWHLKGIKQLLCIPDQSLHPQYPNLKDLLIELLQTEIAYAETGFSEAEDKMPEARLESTTPFGASQSTAKFQLQLTQRMLAIWAQTLITMKIITIGVKGQRRFTEFLADHFTTGDEPIQPDCFRRRYKEKHTASSERLIRILEQMILIIKHEYMSINISAEK